MTKMSSLPRDLAEEILSRVPLKRVRSTCKLWNTISNDVSFQKKHLGKAKVAAASKEEFLGVIMMDFMAYLMSVNLHNKSIKRVSQVISLEDSDQIDVGQVFHCDGLLLCYCVVNDETRLMVWNPYLGQTRWIKPTPKLGKKCKHVKHVIGYEKNSENSSRSYKILSFSDFHRSSVVDYKLYDFNSDSWRVLDVTRNKNVDAASYDRGISLKGNMYWFATEFENGFLLCFDFTKEKFSLRLPLPPFDDKYSTSDTMALSSVREEQLAVLMHERDTLDIEIWITNKIEPIAVSLEKQVVLSIEYGIIHS